MPRIARVSVADTVYHVINRANGRQTIFDTEKDYRHFESLLVKVVEVTGMRFGDLRRPPSPDERLDYKRSATSSIDMAGVGMFLDYRNRPSIEV
jgi:hypothetical protein